MLQLPSDCERSGDG